MKAKYSATSQAMAAVAPKARRPLEDAPEADAAGQGEQDERRGEEAGVHEVHPVVEPHDRVVEVHPVAEDVGEAGDGDEQVGQPRERDPVAPQRPPQDRHGERDERVAHGAHAGGLVAQVGLVGVDDGARTSSRTSAPFARTLAVLATRGRQRVLDRCCLGHPVPHPRRLDGRAAWASVSAAPGTLTRWPRGTPGRAVPRPAGSRARCRGPHGARRRPRRARPGRRHPPAGQGGRWRRSSPT